MDKNMCKRPDRDVPEMICGYSLPCPYHTIIIDTTVEPPTIKRPYNKHISLKQHYRLKTIAEIIKEASDE